MLDTRMIRRGPRGVLSGEPSTFVDPGVVRPASLSVASGQRHRALKSNP